MTEIQLRPYQEDGVAQIREAFMDGVRAVVFVSPTGSGKTVTFSFVARSASALGNSVLIIAHRDSLIKQASRKLSSYGVDHGIIMAGYTPKPHCKVQVGSVQTIVRRIKKCPHLFNFDLVIIDEGHLSMAASYRAIVDAMQEARILAVTATPSRLDGKGLGTHAGGFYDQLILGPTIRELIDMGNLVQPVVYAPEKQLDLTAVKMKGSDYDAEQLAAVVDRPTITGSAVDHYRRICPDVPAIGWCVNIKHAQHAAEEFTAAGIPAIALHGEHSGDERDAAGAKLQSGEVKVVFFCQLLVEGVDWPWVGAVIMLRPTMSLVSYLQVIGRGLRPDPDNAAKKVCYVLDHAGLTFRHGFADEDREWDLNGTRKQKRKKKDGGAIVRIAQCPECFHVFPPAPVCPSCQHVMPKREREIEHVDGELKEITPEMAQSMKRAKAKEISKAKTLDELKALAKKYGYSEKWAEIKFGFKQRAREQYQGSRDKYFDSLFADYNRFGG